MGVQVKDPAFLEHYEEGTAARARLHVALEEPSLREAATDALKRAGFDHPAIPVFFAVDGAAHPTGQKIDGGAWGEDIPRNMAPPLGRFFAPIVARHR